MFFMTIIRKSLYYCVTVVCCIQLSLSEGVYIVSDIDREIYATSAILKMLMRPSQQTNRTRR